MADDFREEIERRIETFPSVDCEVELSLIPARPIDIAGRLAGIVPVEWDQESEFHRTTDDGQDLWFHRVETNNNRVPIPRILRFGERFQEIDDQLKIERFREDAPDLFEDVVEDFGRERALEIATGVGGTGARLMSLQARVRGDPRSDITAEVLLRVDLGERVPADDFRAFIGTEFMGEIIRVEPTSETAYLLGGNLTANIAKVEDTLDTIEEVFDVDREDSAVVCRVIEDTSPDVT